VCDKGFGWAEAQVACRMLGYDTGIAERRSTYGDAELDEEFWRSDLECNGDEESLEDCPGNENPSCGRTEVAGVFCFDKKLLEIPTTTTTTRHNGTQGDIELRGWSGEKMDGIARGNLYVDGKPVCDDLWGLEEALVACRMLGYDTGIPEIRSSYGNAGRKQQFWRSDLECQGDEESLEDCSGNEDPSCGRWEVAGLFCFDKKHLETPTTTATTSAATTTTTTTLMPGSGGGEGTVVVTEPVRNKTCIPHNSSSGGLFSKPAPCPRYCWWNNRRGRCEAKNRRYRCCINKSYYE